MSPGLVTEEEIELSAPQTLTVGTSDVEISATRLGKTRRTFFSIVPLTAGATITLTFGDSPAVANKGVVLSANQPYIETDDPGAPCYQGAIHAISSAPGSSVAIVERFETL